jgi:hypothetical protein
MYEFDKAKFLMERFDDETVLINVVTGHYYSLSGSGPDLFALLETGLSVEEAAEAIGGGSDEPHNVRKLVSDFAARLVEESLLIPRQSPIPRPPRMQQADGKVAVALAPPVLTRFDDMREILLLDPVHQVDQSAGWPNKQ